MDDPVAGRLTYERFFWERGDSVRLFGHEYPVLIRFRGEENAPLEELQRYAFAGFDTRRNDLLAEAEQAVYSYYQEVAPEYRDMLGDAADRVVPVVRTMPELASIVTPTHLMIPRVAQAHERVVGLVCDCTWDPAVGLGLKFVNEVIVEIGPQDIVL